MVSMIIVFDNTAFSDYVIIVIFMLVYNVVFVYDVMPMLNYMFMLYNLSGSAAVVGPSDDRLAVINEIILSFAITSTHVYYLLIVWSFGIYMRRWILIIFHTIIVFRDIICVPCRGGYLPSVVKRGRAARAPT
jgi:hypothetical protein